jgi:hypothetical protein
MESWWRTDDAWMVPISAIRIFSAWRDKRILGENPLRWIDGFVTGDLEELPNEVG